MITSQVFLDMIVSCRDTGRRVSRGKAQKYPPSDASLHGYRVRYYSIVLFMAALP